MQRVFAALAIPAALAVSSLAAVPGISQEERVVHLMSDEIAPESQAFYRAAADAFMAENPGVSIELDFQGNMDEALAVRVAAGEPPEIASMQLERLLTYADLGLLEPATWWFDKYGEDVVPLASIPYKGVRWDIPYALESCDFGSS